MSQNSILESVKGIIERSKRAYDGPAYEADDAYMCLIDSLRDILATGEALPDAEKVVVEAIDELQAFTKLGIFVNNKFSPLSPSMAARAGTKVGDFISAHRLLVITEDKLSRIGVGDEWWPDELAFDPERGHLIHNSYFHRLNPQTMLALSEDIIDKFGLEEALLDYKIQQE